MRRAKFDNVLSNEDVSAVLQEISERLQRTGDNPFRVAAYHKAAAAILAGGKNVATIYEQEGQKGLRRLPGVGKSLARLIAGFLRQGRSQKLDRLRQQDHGLSLLRTLPGVGKRLAERLQESLGTNSLEEVFAAACDGRLRRIP